MGSPTSRARRTPALTTHFLRWNTAGYVVCSLLLSPASCRRFDACGFDGLPCDMPPVVPSPPEPPSEPVVPDRTPPARALPDELDAGLDAAGVPDADDDAGREDLAPEQDARDADAPQPQPEPLPPAHDDAGPDATTVSVPDEGRPRLIAMSPASGGGPVTSERIALSFSEPMDTSSVEAAFPSAGAFEWNSDGSGVQFQLPLPFAAQRQEFGIVLPGSVRDAAGTELGADVEVVVTLAALARVDLPLSFGMTGHRLQGGGGGAFLLTGDAAGGLIYYGAASFSLADLPSFDQNLGLRGAILHLQVCGTGGDPGGALGGIEVMQVSFTTRSAIDQPIGVAGGDLGMLIQPGPIELGQIVRLDVGAQLTSAWQAGESLFQLRFSPHTSNFNGVSDLIYLRRVVNENGATISEGVLNPDPDNAPRIEVEFFH